MRNVFRKFEGKALKR